MLYEVITIPRLSVIPADMHLAGAEVELVSVAEREFRLRAALDIADSYNFV